MVGGLPLPWATTPIFHQLRLDAVQPVMDRSLLGPTIKNRLAETRVKSAFDYEALFCFPSEAEQCSFYSPLSSFGAAPDAAPTAAGT
jgi:hypothetical protein